MPGNAVTFEDLFSLEDMQRIQDEFATATGVASIITRPDGTPITKPSNFTRLCADIILNKGAGCIHCLNSETLLGLPHKAGPVVRPCPSGALQDAAVSLTVDGRHVANWFIGQVRDAAQGEDGMQAYARAIGANETALIEAFREAPAMTPERFQQVAQALFTLANQLSAAAHLKLPRGQGPDSADRFRIILQDIPSVAVQGYGPEGITRYWNKASEQLYGYTAEEALGRNLLDLIIPPEMREGAALAMRKMARDGQAIPAAELTLMRKDGSRVNVFSSHVIVQIPGQPQEMFCIDVDLTERRRAEEALRAEREKLQRLQKTTSLDRMAGAIAHHFNNQLQAVTGYLELALLKPEIIPPEVVEVLNQAMRAADKASEVSSLMLTYLGQCPTEQEILDLSSLCRSGLSKLRAALPATVTLDTILPTTGPAILGNATQLQQVLANLITNAWESCAGGPIHVRVALGMVAASDIPSKHRYPVEFQPLANTYACLSVTDHGSGIVGNTLDSLFDPFFTTKFTGRGLGLPVTLGMVRAHEGAITVESTPGRGSVFRVYLPVVTPVSELPAPTDASAADQGKSVAARTILLAEDNLEVRTLARATLKQLGYLVIEAKDGAEAVELYRQHRAAIACVLCDLVMPNLDGWATIEALRALCPGLPIILVSGYNEARVMAGEHPQKPQAFLAKPYQINQLRDALAQAMGTAG